MSQKFYGPLAVINFLLLSSLFRSGALNDVSDSKQAEELFKRLFIQQRVKQLEAVKRIRTLAGEKRQNLMIATAAESIFKVLKSSRSIVESSGYVPGLTSFPESQETREALSNILENTALFGELLLHFPEISHAVLKDSHEWKVLYEWSVRFSNQTELLDRITTTLIDLVSQELNITDRKPDFINPYYKKPAKKYVPSNFSENQIKKVKKKQKLPRGPRLSSSNIKYDL
ncbi:unnamed protein product [Bemisia tabaci]|uniref:Coiled-coil domain-containing protein 134 n=1 Tax=Bemisia tabaci TaxID=7038 RepID=A0A9P0G1I6_BEMTA|nr:PREDICTED: coiled-coil domain-containing protein 134-like [Bemisia tabaci]CAH0777697.1 unnamed protein product [Bemisia tabaci]